MKQEFDIHSYREIGENYTKKLIYVNGCICKAHIISIRQAINELKFIRVQIREYCSLSVIMLPQNIPTGEKRLTLSDAAIHNYINEKINYYSELENININVINKPDKKDLPSLPDCFIDKSYFSEILKHPKISDLFTIMENDSYKWTANKARLGGLAIWLLNNKKLNPDLNLTNQDLAKIFCPFFSVTFNEKSEKQFQTNRADIYYFNFLK